MPGETNIHRNRVPQSMFLLMYQVDAPSHRSKTILARSDVPEIFTVDLYCSLLWWEDWHREKWMYPPDDPEIDVTASAARVVQ
jgi:hypothetical protein